MANINPKTVFANNDNAQEGWIVTWGPMANGDVGVDPAALLGFSDRSLQVEGTFGVGGTVVWEGSNDGVNFHTLNDPFGVALSFSAAGLKAVTEACQFVRPRVTGGDGTTALTVTSVFRRTKT